MEISNKKKKLIISIFLIFLVTFIFLLNLRKERKAVCGNGICEIYENSINCCEDCGCYENYEVCVKNRCEKREIELSDEEFLNIVEEYFKLRNETIINISQISIISLKKLLAKTSLVITSKNIYGVTIAENKTLFLYECCLPGGKLLDVWTKNLSTIQS